MSTRWVIGTAEREKRRRNTLYGLLLSGLLAGMIAIQNHHYPEEYSDVLLWSVVGFVLLANIVNYWRYRRYLSKIGDHFLELTDKQLQFSTAGEVSSLGFEEIAALRAFRGRDGTVRHIQLMLRNNRGIRLEGYQDLDGLARHLTERLPAEKIMDK